MSSNCPGFQDDLSAYLDGELDGTRHPEVVEHLGSCAACSDRCAALKATSGLIGKSVETVSVPDLWSRIQSSMPSICTVIQDDFSAYLDGELIAPSKEGVDEHLANCADCHEEFQNLSRTNSLISRGLELPETMSLDIWSGLSSRLNEDCGIIKDELSSFYDREVTPDRHRAVTTHLLECSDCRDNLTAITSTSDVLRDHYCPNLPEDFDLWPGIKQKISVVQLAPKEKRRNVFQARRLYAVAAVIAAGVLAAVTGFVNFHPGQPLTPVTAETYLIESALGEPADLAEAVVYEN